MSLPTIVDAQWLNENKNTVKILCVSSGLGPKPNWKEYKEKHYGKFVELMEERKDKIPKEVIPNAIFLDCEIAFYPGQFQRLSLYPHELFQEYVRLLGINEGDHVVVYGQGPAAGMLFAARAWWAFKAYGLENVSVLNGGLDAWKSAGYPVDSHLAQVPKGNWSGHTIPKSWIISYEELNTKDSEGKALFDRLDTLNYFDARPHPEFTGEVPLGFPAPEATGAHIRGAKNVPLVAIMTPNGLKSKEEIQTALTSAGFKSDEPVVTACISGVQASLLALGLFSCEIHPCLFNGSMLEVAARGSHYINEK